MKYSLRKKERKKLFKKQVEKERQSVKLWKCSCVWNGLWNCQGTIMPYAIDSNFWNSKNKDPTKKL